MLPSIKTPNTKKIALNFKNQLLINVSPYVLENFVILQAWFKNLARIEEASNSSTGPFIESKKSFNYFLSNKIGLPVKYTTK
jgi:hypothetical protein